MRDGLCLAAVAVAVFVLSSLCFGMAATIGGPPLIWAANGLVLALLLKSSVGKWPSLLVGGLAGEFVACLTTGQGLAAGSGIALADGLQVLLCGAVLRRVCGHPIDLARWSHLIAFALVASLLGPVVSEALTTGWLDLIGQTRSWPATATWAVADCLGLIVLTPSILTLSVVRADLMERPFKIRDCLALAGLAAITGLVFTDGRQGLIFLVPTALLLVTLQTERLGAALGLLCITVIGCGSIIAEVDRPHLIANDNLRLAIIQLFLAMCAASATPVAGLILQRRRISASLDAARLRAEQAQSETLEQRRWIGLATQAASIGYWRLNTLTSEITWSDEMYQMFDQTPGQPPPLETAMAMVHPADRAQADEQLARALATGESYTGGVRIVHHDGSLRYTSGRAVCERGPDGTVTAVVGALVDITQLKLVENALSQSEAKYRGLADHATDVLAGYKADGTFTYLSPAIRTLLGYLPEELVGKRCYDIMHRDDVPSAIAQFAAYAKSPHGGPPRIEYRALHKDGSIVWLEAHPRAFFNPDGQLVEFQDVVRDITARKQMAIDLEAARAAAEASAEAKRLFLANMSHELRTPLTSILGFSELAATQPELTAKTRGHIECVTEASKTLLSTINDILDFSKLEAGQVPIKPVAVGLRAKMQACLDRQAMAAADKGLKLQLDCDIDESVTVMADPYRLHQLLGNLIGNAIKFTTTGGIVVKARRDAGQATLKVEIVDTGAGIEPDRLDKLFLHFSQIDGSLSRDHLGSGLGLAICKGVVEAMGGQIGADSSVGRGSRFWFQIPAPLSDAPAEALAAVAKSKLRSGLRILIADDHATNRELVRLFLSPYAAELSEAVDGAQAVELSKTIPFDLILMDLHMPILDGLRAASRVRSGKGLNSMTPIIAFSADSDSAHPDTLRKFGLDDFIAKPVSGEALIGAIAAWTSAEGRAKTTRLVAQAG